MNPEPKPSTGAPVARFVLSIPILLLWVLLLAMLSDLGRSDAAGNAMTQGFAAIAILILWLLLAILALIAVIKGTLPWPAWVAALILIPASCVATFAALDLLARPSQPPFLWPIIIPAAVPPLVVAFCLWAGLPAMRARVPALQAGGFVWGTTLLLCLSILPMLYLRELAVEQVATARANYAADFAKLPADAPLWEWTPFLTTPDQSRVSAVLERIRHLDRRQSDAEIMLDRGDFPLGYLGRFDLDPTPALCDKARALLRRRAAALVPQNPDVRPYAEVAWPVADAVAAMKWLVGYDCSCEAESLAWESMAKAYRGTNYDIYELAHLREPKNLGQSLREDPGRFSMLTPKARLKAWLKYADEKDLREQALAGARKLDHRTADAVDMLGENQSAARTLLEYLPVLDLEATEPLCGAALRVLERELGRIYRPRDNDPRPYSELLERWGRGDPFADLKWLAQHGCAADAEVSDAELLVKTYQDSPARAAMLATLATLAQLHRKP